MHLIHRYQSALYSLVMFSCTHYPMRRHKPPAWSRQGLEPTTSKCRSSFESSRQASGLSSCSNPGLSTKCTFQRSCSVSLLSSQGDLAVVEPDKADGSPKGACQSN